MPTISRDKAPYKKMTVKAETPEKPKLVLPSESNIPPDRLSESVIMLYGRKGIGKTSLASQFEDALIFMFERGRRNLSVRQVPQKNEPRLDWDRFVSYVELFIKSDEYSTAVIDTIDRCYICCYEAVCKRNGIASPDQSANGYAIWDEIAAEFEAVLCMLQESGKGLVMLSHEKARPLVTKVKGLKREDEDAGFKYERIEPSCKPAAFRFIQEICDYVFYYSYKDEYRTITVRSPNDVAWTSCGLANKFYDPDGKPLNVFKVGNTPETAFESLIKAYNNELYDFDYIPTSKKR